MENCDILIVEDSYSDFKLTSLVFQHIAPDLVWKHSIDGVEALDYLAKIRESGQSYPQLILLDLKMPRMGGLEFLEAYQKESFPYIPIVTFSSSLLTTDQDKALDLGAHQHMVKPLVFQEYQDTLQRIIDYYFMMPTI